jgi:hypothetical protein
MIAKTIIIKNFIKREINKSIKYNKNELAYSNKDICTADFVFGKKGNKYIIIKNRYGKETMGVYPKSVILKYILK